MDDITNKDGSKKEDRISQDKKTKSSVGGHKNKSESGFESD